MYDCVRKAREERNPLLKHDDKENESKKSHE